MGNYIGTRNCDDLPLVSHTMSPVDTEQQQEEEVVEMSLEEIKSHIKIYPNPTEGMIHVLFKEKILEKIVKAEVFNPHGALIKSNLIMSSDNPTRFDIWGYPNRVDVLKFMLNTNGFLCVIIIYFCEIVVFYFDN